ncbi:MAG: UDP-N-acetylmuramoyl-L-alanyl-D-glutamate--2,6-diaminopimelate ligase, partial [Rickettsiella sp.]|nr:UDP-N-acetylmuramoyl-L-alanyl-D-glutamate--2,6-diaminopimelate ligase [Rickettsiella sp.]
ISTTKHNPLITGLCQDSRQLEAGNLFFAYPGVQSDGRNFLQEVIEKGASAVLLEPDENRLIPGASIPIIPLANLSSYLGLIAARFYGYPSQSISVIGITGTNGKTSCTHFLAQCLQQLNQPCGVIGTLGNGIYPSLKSGVLTTPDAIELQQLFCELRKNADTVFMEVSSHRLAQQRLNGTEFFIAAFTNLTRDHLDYHGNMQEYARAKRSFFDLAGVQQAILNADDPYGQVWLDELAGKFPIMGYTLANVTASLAHIPHVVAKSYKFNRQGLQAEIETPWGEFFIENPFLIGKFNLSNLLLVITILKLLNFSLTDIAKLVANLKGVQGRMEAFHAIDKPMVVVDYAHTPDALQQALKSLRAHCQGALYCVFGCGGDRDKGKRVLMAAVAEQFADYLIVTNDNPRFEDPEQIIQEIQQGLTGAKPVYIEQDRQLAISYAIQKAEKEDVVLVAGKGHEAYQLIAGIKYPFSDIQEVRRLLNLEVG